MSLKYIIRLLLIVMLESCSTPVVVNQVQEKIIIKKHHSRKIIPTEEVAVQDPENFRELMASKITDLKDFNHVIFTGTGLNDGANDFTRVNFPLQNNYVIQLELFKVPKTSRDSVIDAIYTYWGMAHVMTFGIIPITKTNRFSIRSTLFDKIGQVIRQRQSLNEARVWYWSPLILFKGLNMFSSFHEIESSDVDMRSTFLR